MRTSERKSKCDQNLKLIMIQVDPYKKCGTALPWLVISKVKQTVAIVNTVISVQYVLYEVTRPCLSTLIYPTNIFYYYKNENILMQIFSYLF